MLYSMIQPAEANYLTRLEPAGGHCHEAEIPMQDIEVEIPMQDMEAEIPMQDMLHRRKHQLPRLTPAG